MKHATVGQHAPNLPDAPKPPALLRRATVRSRTGLSDTTIRVHIKAGTFPAPVKASKRIPVWLESDIDRWIAQRVEATTARG